MITKPIGKGFTVKIGVNQPCLCGSGKKYKKCCGGPSRQESSGSRKPYLRTVPPEVIAMLKRQKAEELVREQQQGFGRPIMSFKFGDQQIIAAKNTLYYSTTWKTMTDFLSYYIKKVLGDEWGNSEIQKPYADRHPIMQWYHEYCTFQ